jgi:hypothetical protein
MLLEPVVAPAGTVAEMKFELSTVSPALAPLKVRAVAPVQLTTGSVVQAADGTLFGTAKSGQQF